MRKTIKAVVEVTIETEFPQSYSGEGLAADLSDWGIPRIMADYGNVVVITASALPDSE